MNLTETRIEALRWSALGQRGVRKRHTPPKTTPKTWAALVEAGLVLRFVRRALNRRGMRGAIVYYEITPAGLLVLKAFDLGERLAGHTTSRSGYGGFGYDEDQGP